LIYDAPRFGDGTATASKKDLDEDARLLREIEAMSSTDYKRKMQIDKGFAARVEAAFARQYLNKRRGNDGSKSAREIQAGRY